MLSVVITSMPAPSISSTSCHRFSWRPPGALVWANSSTSTTSGRAREHRVDVHLGAASLRGSRPSRRGIDREVADLLGGVRPAVCLDDADRRRRCRARGGAGPRRAWRRSCRRPARRRGRCAAIRVPSVRSLTRRSVESRRSARLSRAARSTPGSPSTPSAATDRCSHRSTSSTVVDVDARGRRRPGAPAAGRWRPRCAGRGPTPTRSPRRPAPRRRRSGRSASRYAATRSSTAASRSGLSGPRFEPELADPSYPAPAADGREWKYSGDDERLADQLAADDLARRARRAMPSAWSPKATWPIAGRDERVDDTEQHGEDGERPRTAGTELADEGAHVSSLPGR